MITQKIKVDVNHTKNPEPIVCRLGESGTRIIRFELVEYVDGIAEAVEYTQENPTAQLRIVKPDNTFVIINAVRAEPTERVIFDVVISAEVSQVAGIGFYDFRIYDGAGEEPAPDAFLYTEHGQVIIDDDMLTDEMIESVAAVNGLIFPDDFLTSADLSDYATKSYVDDAIAAIPDPLHNYSTNETIVGKWIDGKPIYEKTINIGPVSKSNSWQSFTHDVANLKRVITCAGWMFDDTGGGTYMYPIPENRPNTQNGVCIEITPSDINIFHNWLDSVSECYITMTYTKTTD